MLYMHSRGLTRFENDRVMEMYRQQLYIGIKSIVWLGVQNDVYFAQRPTQSNIPPYCTPSVFHVGISVYVVQLITYK